MNLKQLLNVPPKEQLPMLHTLPPVEPKQDRNNGSLWLAVAGLTVITFLGLVMVVASLALLIFGVKK